MEAGSAENKVKREGVSVKCRGSDKRGKEIWIAGRDMREKGKGGKGRKHEEEEKEAAST